MKNSLNLTVQVINRSVATYISSQRHLLHVIWLCDVSKFVVLLIIFPLVPYKTAKQERR